MSDNAPTRAPGTGEGQANTASGDWRPTDPARLRWKLEMEKLNTALSTGLSDPGKEDTAVADSIKQLESLYNEVQQSNLRWWRENDHTKQTASRAAAIRFQFMIDTLPDKLQSSGGFFARSRAAKLLRIFRFTGGGSSAKPPSSVSKSDIESTLEELTAMFGKELEQGERRQK